MVRDCKDNNNNQICKAPECQKTSVALKICVMKANDKEPREFCRQNARRTIAIVCSCPDVASLLDGVDGG